MIDMSNNGDISYILNQSNDIQVNGGVREKRRIIADWEGECRFLSCTNSRAHQGARELSYKKEEGIL